MSALPNLTMIKPDSVQSYLSRTGWAKVDYRLTDVLKYQLPSTDIIVLVPKNTRSSDYGQSLRNVVKTLSQVEARDFNAVIKNIMSPTVDTLKFRFIGSGADVGSLPLDYTLAAVANIRDSLVYSACSEINKQPMYSRALKDAVKVVEKSRFGQTEIGSFVISVEMPLDIPVLVKQGAQASLLGVDNVDPIQRRVISRIIRSAQKARAIAIDGDSIDPENDFKINLNANLAEALAALKPEGIDTKRRA